MRVLLRTMTSAHASTCGAELASTDKGDSDEFTSARFRGDACAHTGVASRTPTSRASRFVHSTMRPAPMIDRERATADFNSVRFRGDAYAHVGVAQSAPWPSHRPKHERTSVFRSLFFKTTLRSVVRPRASAVGLVSGRRPCTRRTLDASWRGRSQLHSAVAAFSSAGRSDLRDVGGFEWGRFRGNACAHVGVASGRFRGSACVHVGVASHTSPTRASRFVYSTMQPASMTDRERATAEFTSGRFRGNACAHVGVASGRFRGNACAHVGAASRTSRAS